MGSDHPHPLDPAAVEAARAGGLPPAEAAQVADLAALIGDPVRSRILAALLGGERLCVGDVALAVGISEDAASYALRVLRAAGLVTWVKEGRFVFYSVVDGGVRPAVAEVLDRLRALAGGREVVVDAEG